MLIEECNLNIAEEQNNEYRSLPRKWKVTTNLLQFVEETKRKNHQVQKKEEITV